MPDFIIADTEEQYRSAALLFKEYANWLNIDLQFQHFEEELTLLKTMYAAPDGGITLNYMTAAINLYMQYCFYEIPAYYNNPNTTAIYFEKII